MVYVHVYNYDSDLPFPTGPTGTPIPRIWTMVHPRPDPSA